jgi:hypothetical protein
MKKYIYILFIIFLLQTGVSQAQIKFGVYTGLGISRLGSSNLNFIAAGSYTLGATASIPIKNNFQFVTGLSYEILQASRNQLAFRIDGKLAWGRNSMTTQLGYFTIPTILKYTLKVKQKPIWYIEGGGYISYLTSFKTQGTIGYKYPLFPEDEYNEALSKYNRLAAGISLGTGFFINSHFSIGGRYNYGLTSINSEKVNFQNTQFLLGYYF